MHRFKPGRHQAGFSNLQMVVLILVIATVQVGLAAYQRHHVSEVFGKIIGGQAKTLKVALDDYLKGYGPLIIAKKDVMIGTSKVADSMAPTLAELDALGLLHAVIGKPANGGEWVYKIEKQPAGCDDPSAPLTTMCNLLTTVYPTNPLTSRTNPAAIDGVALNAAIAEIGSDGGYSDAATPNIVSGGGGGWTRPNDLGAVAGVLYAIGGYGSISYTALRDVGEVCEIPGAVATSKAGQQLICRGTHYVSTLASLPSYRVASKVLVKDGDVVQKPVCETGGTPAYSFEMTQTTVDVAIAPPLQALYLATQDQGTSWKIVIHMKDKNTTDASANPYSITALFHVECNYP